MEEASIRKAANRSFQFQNNYDIILQVYIDYLQRLKKDLIFLYLIFLHRLIQDFLKLIFLQKEEHYYTGFIHLKSPAAKYAQSLCLTGAMPMPPPINNISFPLKSSTGK